MKTSSKYFTVLLTALALTPMLAQAHPNHGTASFASGLAHPLTGFDHLLAMVAVGLWAVQLGGRAVWTVPLTFVSVMTLGAFLGMSGMALPFVETGILASVLILGVLVAASVRLPLAASAVIVGVFALAHGQAHGTEMPVNASGFVYALGFVSVTAQLHLTGIGWGLAMKHLATQTVIRYTGGTIAALGVYLCFVA